MGTKELARSKVDHLAEIVPSWADTVYGQHSDLWTAVNVMLQLFLKSGLPMSSERLKQFSLEDMETLAVYVMDLAEAGVTVNDIATDGHAVRRLLRFFPSSSELVTAMLACRQKREPAGIIRDGVYIFQGNAVRIVSRGTAERRGWRYWEEQVDAEIANGLIKPRPRAALPASREGILARMMALPEAKAVPDPSGPLRDEAGRLVVTPEKRAEIERELQAIRAKMEAAQKAASKKGAGKARADRAK